MYKNIVVDLLGALNSVTRLDEFSKFLETKFLAKVTQLYGDFLGYFDKYNFLSKNYSGDIWAAFGKFWVTLDSNIWSCWH